jgi:hypothetical protein
MKMSYGPGLTCSRIETALPAYFDKILVTHHWNTMKKVTFTTDLSLIPLYLTINSTLFNIRRTETHEFEFCCVVSILPGFIIMH